MQIQLRCERRSDPASVTARLIADARAFLPDATGASALRIIDRWKGPAYGVLSEAQARFIVQVARACGLILDPVYTGKALFALAALPDKPARALFIHTGGLPGLLAQTSDLTPFMQSPEQALARTV